MSILWINSLLMVVLPILTDALSRIWGALLGTSRLILVLVRTNRKEALDIFELGLRKGRTDISLSSWRSRKNTQEKLDHHVYKVGKENGIKKKREWNIYSVSCMIFYTEQSWRKCFNLHLVFQYEKTITKAIYPNPIWFWNLSPF